jgi:hypothetical protein
MQEDLDKQKNHMQISLSLAQVEELNSMLNLLKVFIGEPSALSKNDGYYPMSLVIKDWLLNLEDGFKE